jgi:uncharacterized alpha/beta hydrolase family protein
MVKVKERTLDTYIDRMMSRLLKRYPTLEFEVVKWSDGEATLYYRPYSEDAEYPIIKTAGSVATDAVIDGFRLYVIPAPDA